MATSGAEQMQAGGGFGSSFSVLLEQARAQARRLEDEGVISLAIPLAGGDPFTLLPHLDGEPPGERGGFRFLWDGAPGLCIAASGRTNSLELSGPRRFELAQRFAAAALARLTGDGMDKAHPCPSGCVPRG